MEEEDLHRDLGECDDLLQKRETELQELEDQVLHRTSYQLMLNYS